MAAASVRRKIAVATWRPSRDGRLYSRLTLDATALTSHVERLRQESGVRVTVTHAVGKAVALAVRAVPEVHARVVFGRIVPFPSCDVSFPVDVEDGVDLGPMKVREADRKSVVAIARELEAGAARLRARQDTDFATSNRLVEVLPGVVLRPLLAVASLVNGGLGRRAFGQPGFPLGSACVTSVGTLGLDEGYVAPVPFARVPLYILVGPVRDAAVVVDGAVVVRPQLVLTATSDHRLVDGAHAGRIAIVLRDTLQQPELLDRDLSPQP
ncbi:MAG: 2-oxo acid dehydrogenase subunit E2 [Actinomycetota bacterium]|nr:2-oxo acid dehydrogenase subunit E2 [Actinomycetota bacterium]